MTRNSSPCTNSFPLRRCNDTLDFFCLAAPQNYTAFIILGIWNIWLLLFHDMHRSEAYHMHLPGVSSPISFFAYAHFESRMMKDHLL